MLSMFSKTKMTIHDYKAQTLICFRGRSLCLLTWFCGNAVLERQHAAFSLLSSFDSQMTRIRASNFLPRVMSLGSQTVFVSTLVTKLKVHDCNKAS